MNIDEDQFDPLVEKVKLLEEEIEMDDEIQIQTSDQEICFLPPEIWEIILHKVHDPSDVLRCRDVCYNWNVLLEQKVIDAHFQLILPKLVPYLGGKDLLSCSAVSKDWNHWIDSSVQNFRKNIFVWADDYKVGIDGRLPFLRLWETDDATDIEQYLTEQEFVGGHFNNQFRYRHVVIREWREDDDMSDAEYDALCSLLLKFLERFGKFIYQLEIFFVTNTLTRMIRLLDICLRNTPNLEIFTYKFVGWFQVAEEDEQEVDAIIAASPFPNSTIQKLRMDGPKKIEDVFIERYANQLVYVYEFFRFDVLRLISKGVTFENLKVLRGSAISISLSVPDFLVRITELMTALKWTLAEVDIKFISRYGAEYNTLVIDNFFQAIREHQPRIQKFRFALVQH